MERWDYKKIDKDELHKQVERARWYLLHLETSVKVGSILTDVDYGEAFDAVDRIYNIAMIGELAADNADRDRAHKAELKKKGLTS